MAAYTYALSGADDSPLMSRYIQGKYNDVLSPLDESLGKLYNLAKQENDLHDLTEKITELRCQFREYAIKNSLPKTEEDGKETIQRNQARQVPAIKGL